MHHFFAAAVGLYYWSVTGDFSESWIERVYEHRLKLISRVFSFIIGGLSAIVFLLILGYAIIRSNVNRASK